MKEINELLRNNNIKPLKYIKKNNVYIVDTKDNKYVIKKNKKNEIYDYLNSRNFRYYPEIIKRYNEYEITKYISDTKMPLEQKMLDLIHLVSLLHSKTSFYREIDDDEYKKIYEDISGNIEHLYSYYIDLIEIIESKVYMSPSEYMLARNISKILSSLNYSKSKLEEWLKIIEKKRKQRFVVIHNNLDLNHYIKNDLSYLISWDKARIDLPIFDLYKLYIRYSLDYDFESILKIYEKTYPLLEEEKILLFILISLPKKIEFDNSEYINTKNVSNQVDILYKTEKLLNEYSKKEEKNYK